MAEGPTFGWTVSRKMGGNIMTTLELIIAELKRQHEESRHDGLGYLRIEDPEKTCIDGDVDLVALAAAIDKQRSAP